METGLFYFLKDSYYERFPNSGLMANKHTTGRPCYYCIEKDGLYWMVPISSKIEKYTAICDKMKKRYKNYYGIRFAYVNGQKRAFLIQNICPVTQEYVDCQYMVNRGNTPVRIQSGDASSIIKAAKEVLRLHDKGIRTTLSDISYIQGELTKK